MDIFNRFSRARTNRTNLMTKELNTHFSLGRSTHTVPSTWNMGYPKHVRKAGYETTGILPRLVMSPEQVFVELTADPSERAFGMEVDGVSSSAGTIAPTDDIPSTMATSQIITILGQHKCADVTPCLVLDACSKVPFAGGGGGQVYRGMMCSDESRRHVAIKCHRIMGRTKGSAALRDAAKELYAWSKCQHSNVLPLLGLAQYRDQLAMVSPFIERGSLSNFLLKRPKFDRLKACLQIGTGLAYLHDLDIVHGDLKAENALVANDGTIKLVDFGSSKIKNHSLRFSSGNGILRFTPGWAAPEVLSNHDRYRPTKMSDVYAFGMTALEVITSETPFVDVPDKRLIAYRVIAGVRPNRPKCCIPPSDPGEVVWSLLQRCWAPDPAGRPSAIETRDIIRSVKIDRATLLPGVHGNRKYCAPMCHYTLTSQTSISRTMIDLYH